jgi:hypothetical protein
LQISEALKISLNEAFIEQEKNILSDVVTVATRFIRQSKASAVMGGHYDVVEPLSDFFKDEIGINISNIWCSSPDRATQDIPFYKEAQWEAILLEGKYDIVFGNAVALDIAKATAKKLQIDIPNYKFLPLKYPYTPYMGFRGAHYILKEIIN